MTPTDTRPIKATPTRRPVSRRSWIAGIVAAVVLVGGGTGTWLLTRGSGGGGIQRIAVMPIEDISGQDGVFVDAMHAALTSALSGLGDVGVESRSTMMVYKTDPKPTRDIANELSLDAIVEITVFRAGDVMRINVQFSDPRTTRSLWSDTYERDVSNVLAAQSDIVARIAAGVAGALGIAPSATQSGEGG